LVKGVGASIHGGIAMRLRVGTTAEETRAIAGSLQARVKGLCHLEEAGEKAE
jgi:hypothetical protein